VAVRVLHATRTDAAYVALQPVEPAAVRHTVLVDDAPGLLLLDYDAAGQLVGLEVLDATRHLPPALLAHAEQVEQLPHGRDLEVAGLLDDLCASLGICLPAAARQRIVTTHWETAEALAAAILLAEGFADPTRERGLYRAVLAAVARHRQGADVRARG